MIQNSYMSNDGRNHLISVVNALGETYTYHYDNADHQTEQIDPAGKGILYTYNVRGDLAVRSYLGEEVQGMFLGDYYVKVEDGKWKMEKL